MRKIPLFLILSSALIGVYASDNTTKTAKRYTDRFDAYHALKWAFTNSETPNTDSDGYRVLCIEPNANTACTGTFASGWNMKRQHYALSADDALFGSTVTQFKTYTTSGAGSCDFLTTGGIPGVGWQLKDTFYAINSADPVADGWPLYFTTSGVTYKLRQFYIWQSNGLTCTLTTPTSDTAPSGYEYTYTETISTYFTGGDTPYTGTAGAGVVAAFQANNRVWTQHESLLLYASGFQRTCWRRDGGLCELTGATWRNMRNIYIASTNDPAYAGYVTVYNVCQPPGANPVIQTVVTTGCLSGWTSIGTPVLITDRSIWPDTIAKPGGGTWYIRGLQLFASVNTTNTYLVLDEGDRGPAGYTRLLYFWAYW